MRFAALASLLLAAAPVPAQVDERIEIDMSSFKYMPSTITLRHDRAYTLHFTNRSDGGHDFVAKGFFSAAKVSPADKARIDKGRIELGGGDAVDIHLVAPAAGRYEAHCSHFMHSTFGMKATIVVT